MRLIPLLLMPLLLSFGCAGPDTASRNHDLESRTQACLSLHHMAKNADETSNPCRSQPPLLERVGNALGGFAAAMRDPNQ